MRSSPARAAPQTKPRFLNRAAGFAPANGKSAPALEARPKRSNFTHAISRASPNNPAPPLQPSSTTPRVPPSGDPSANPFPFSGKPQPPRPSSSSVSSPDITPLNLKISKQSLKRNSLPHALVARATGTIYFALLPRSACDDAVVRLAQAATRIFESSSVSGGRATLLFAPRAVKQRVHVWGRPDFALMHRLKSAFDPHNIFAPARLLPEK